MVETEDWELSPKLGALEICVFLPLTPSGCFGCSAVRLISYFTLGPDTRHGPPARANLGKAALGTSQRAASPPQETK